MNKNLDREMQDKYEVVVEAEDAQGRRGESGTATVFITLQDVNDNFPIFTQSEPLSLGPGGVGALREEPGVHLPLPPPQSGPTSEMPSQCPPSPHMLPRLHTRPARTPSWAISRSHSLLCVTYPESHYQTGPVSPDPMTSGKPTSRGAGVQQSARARAGP